MTCSTEHPEILATTKESVAHIQIRSSMCILAQPVSPVCIRVSILAQEHDPMARSLVRCIRNTPSFLIRQVCLRLSSERVFCVVEEPPVRSRPLLHQVYI